MTEAFQQMTREIGKIVVVSLSRRLVLSAGALALTLALLGFLPLLRAHAQTGSQAWADPVNISESGIAGTPHLVVSSEGSVFSYWQEVVVGSAVRNPPSMVASYADGQWTSVARLSLPFSEHSHEVVAASQDQLDAYWIDTNGDLLHKRVRASNFASPNAWGAPTRMDRSVVAFDAAADGSGGLQVIYLKVEEEGSAAILHQRSLNGGATWSLPESLFESDYLRRFVSEGPLPGGNISTEQQTIHLSLTAIEDGERSLVLAGWDVPPLKRVFVSRSVDRGESWEEAQVFDGPQDADPYASPEQLRFFAHESTILALWNVVEAGGSCTVATRVSTDLSESWSSLRLSPAGMDQCPDSLRAIGDTEDGLLIQFVEQDQAYLVAWDGEHWALPQPQDGLADFIDADTLEFVDYGCLQIGLAGTQLVAVGCDQAGGADVYASFRSLGDVGSWYDLTLGWSREQVQLLEDASLGPIATTVDGAGDLHIVFTQVDRQADSGPESALYHTYWNGGLSEPVKVISSLPGIADGVSLAVTGGGQMLAVWTGGLSGELYYSTSSAVSAGTSSGWREAERVLSDGSIARHPSLAVDAKGDVVAVYAVPVNEGRGVYAITWDEVERLWSEPVQVYDAANASCPVVIDTTLVAAPTGELHTIWTCSTMTGGVGALGLNYARSDDAAKSWSTTEVTDEAVVSSQIGIDGSGSVHIVWQMISAEEVSTWELRSSDSGATWTSPRSISVNRGMIGPSALVTDTSGRLQLLETRQTGTSRPQLYRSTWNGRAWLPSETLPLRAQDIGDIQTLSAAFRSGELLDVAYGGLGPRSSSLERGLELTVAERKLAPASDETVIALQATEVAPSITPTMNPTAGPSPIPTDDLTPVDNNDLAAPPATGFGGLLASLWWLAGLFVLGAVAVYLYLRRR